MVTPCGRGALRLNAPHLRAEPVPIRIAILPAVVAAVILETWLAVRLLVRRPFRSWWS